MGFLVEVDNFRSEVKTYDNEDIRLFVPTMYQKDIFGIDYDNLWDKGIRVITYDIDDTLANVFVDKVTNKVPGLKVPVPKKTIKFFRELKQKHEFKLGIITNENEGTAKRFCKMLRFDFSVCKKKNDPNTWETAKAACHADNSEMLHIGNKMRTDVFDANSFGIASCLVRSIAKNPVKKVLKRESSVIAEELEERGIWHKHHVNSKDDQYYQLGEEQKNSPNFRKDDAFFEKH